MTARRRRGLPDDDDSNGSGGATELPARASSSSSPSSAAALAAAALVQWEALTATAAARTSGLQLRRVETRVQLAGGVVAALLAIKYASSLRAACLLGVLSGVFAHSLYADVLRRRHAPMALGIDGEDNESNRPDDDDQEKDESDDGAIDPDRPRAAGGRSPSSSPARRQPHATHDPEPSKS